MEACMATLLERITYQRYTMPVTYHTLAHYLQKSWDYWSSDQIRFTLRASRETLIDVLDSLYTNPEKSLADGYFLCDFGNVYLQEDPTIEGVQIVVERVRSKQAMYLLINNPEIEQAEQQFTAEQEARFDSYDRAIASVVKEVKSHEST
jgi:hypothetical protein